MKTLPDKCVDVICTDPPYKYLNHKLDRDFDETIFFDEAVRVLKDNGWVIIFGRGTSFYRWNVMLADRGMTFKEEIIWNKQYGGTVFNALNRMHETISISVKGSGSLFKNKIPYVEKREYNTDEMRQDIKRLLPVIGNRKDLDALIAYLDNGTLYSGNMRKKSINIQSDTKSINRVVGTMRTITEGIKESSIISILNNTRHNIHPTEKPVRLIERLLLLVTRGGLVLDPFAGSGSCRMACHNLGLDFIGCEIDEEYYSAAEKRYRELCEPNNSN
jgi:site-specific DNA-methyltransferase (adenine-specific)